MSEILIHRKQGIVRITLNRPAKLNALTSSMWRQLAELIHAVGQSSSDRVLVLSGSGKAFSSGADLTSPEAHGPVAVSRMRAIGQAALALHTLAKPTIARVEGVAAGGGLTLALGCDIVVAAEDARLLPIFSQRGLSIDVGGSWLLPRLVGLHRAKELVFLADELTGLEAAALGLVNKAVPGDELDRVVEELARRLRAAPTLAIAASKSLLNFGTLCSMEQAVEAEALAQAANHSTNDTKEALAAFRERREPNFTGT
jgi:enoyl-CoA hydratase/carnithine racemase